jgi:hypothetical protein
MKDANASSVGFDEKKFSRQHRQRALGSRDDALDAGTSFPDDAHSLLSVVRSEIRVYPEVGHGDERFADEYQRQSIAPPRQYVCFLQEILERPAVGVPWQSQRLAAGARADTDAIRKLRLRKPSTVGNFRT